MDKVLFLTISLGILSLLVILCLGNGLEIFNHPEQERAIREDALRGDVMGSYDSEEKAMDDLYTSLDDYYRQSYNFEKPEFRKRLADALDRVRFVGDDTNGGYESEVSVEKEAPRKAWPGRRRRHPLCGDSHCASPVKTSLHQQASESISEEDSTDDTDGDECEAIKERLRKRRKGESQTTDNVKKETSIGNGDKRTGLVRNNVTTNKTMPQFEGIKGVAMMQVSNSANTESQTTQISSQESSTQTLNENKSSDSGPETSTMSVASVDQTDASSTTPSGDPKRVNTTDELRIAKQMDTFVRNLLLHASKTGAMRKELGLCKTYDKEYVSVKNVNSNVQDEIMKGMMGCLSKIISISVKPQPCGEMPPELMHFLDWLLLNGVSARDEFKQFVADAGGTQRKLFLFAKAEESGDRNPLSPALQAQPKRRTTSDKNTAAPTPVLQNVAKTTNPRYLQTPRHHQLLLPAASIDNDQQPPQVAAVYSPISKENHQPHYYPDS